MKIQGVFHVVKFVPNEYILSDTFQGVYDDVEDYFLLLERSEGAVVAPLLDPNLHLGVITPELVDDHILYNFST